MHLAIAVRERAGLAGFSKEVNFAEVTLGINCEGLMSKPP